MAGSWGRSRGNLAVTAQEVIKNHAAFIWSVAQICCEETPSSSIPVARLFGTQGWSDLEHTNPSKLGASLKRDNPSDMRSIS
jgi:hypothetical protein